MVNGLQQIQRDIQRNLDLGNRADQAFLFDQRMREREFSWLRPLDEPSSTGFQLPKVDLHPFNPTFTSGPRPVLTPSFVTERRPFANPLSGAGLSATSLVDSLRLVPPPALWKLPNLPTFTPAPPKPSFLDIIAATPAPQVDLSGFSLPSAVDILGLTRQQKSKMDFAKDKALDFGLRITATTNGKHVPGSYHYKSRAIDVAGSPAAMARFYRFFAPRHPTELFYDPLGGIKNGRPIGAIGGHGDHVHIAF